MLRYLLPLLPGNSFPNTISFTALLPYERDVNISVNRKMLHSPFLIHFQDWAALYAINLNYTNSILAMEHPFGAVSKQIPPCPPKKELKLPETAHVQTYLCS